MLWPVIAVVGVITAACWMLAAVVAAYQLDQERRAVEERWRRAVSGYGS